VVTPGNVLINGGFESGLQVPWYDQLPGEASPINTASIVEPGSSSNYAYTSHLVRTNTGPYSVRLLYQDVQLCAGQIYNIAFDWRFLNNGPDCYAYFNVKYTDGSPEIGLTVVRATDSDWHTVISSFTAASGGAIIQLLHLCANYESGEGHFDNVSVSPVV
jgi:hypothetical protein